MRVIVRFSIDNDLNGLLTNSLRNILEQFGIVLNPARTATYETDGINEHQLAAAMEEFWEIIATHQGQGTLDHFWMYTDQ